MPLAFKLAINLLPERKYVFWFVDSHRRIIQLIGEDEQGLSGQNTIGEFACSPLRVIRRGELLLVQVLNYLSNGTWMPVLIKLDK